MLLKSDNHICKNANQTNENETIRNTVSWTFQTHGGRKFEPHLYFRVIIRYIEI